MGDRRPETEDRRRKTEANNRFIIPLFPILNFFETLVTSRTNYGQALELILNLQIGNSNDVQLNPNMLRFPDKNAKLTPKSDFVPRRFVL